MADTPTESPQASAQKRLASTASLAYNVVLSVVKIIAAVVTGSVSILSEAVHSSTDVVASLMAFFGVRAAAQPPDEEHPYGHGKIESLVGFVESILLLLIVVYIVVESVQKLIAGTPVENLNFAVWVMAFSSVTSVLVARYVLGVAKQTRSLALQSNGQHLMADFVTSAGVLLALLGTRFTGLPWLDPVAALVIAGWMALGALRLANLAFHHLIDRSLEPGEIQRIEEIISSQPGVLGHHRLRTRLSGEVRLIDFHIVVPNEWSVVQAHDVADELEKRIMSQMKPAHVVVHVDPFDPDKAAD